MNSSQPNALGRALRGFFADHLPRVRGSSPHTILSYRDTLVLFLRFVAARRKRSVSQLDLGDLDPAEVLAFLEHLETTRHNLVATEMFDWQPFTLFSGTVRRLIPHGSSIASGCWPFRSSAPVPAPFTTWNTMRCRRCWRACIAPLPMDAATTCCSPPCSIPAPECRKWSRSVSATCSWKRFPKFVSTARVARSAGVLCGRKPRNSYRFGSGNQGVTSHPIDRSSVITGGIASRGSVCGTYFESTAYGPKSRCPRGQQTAAPTQHAPQFCGPSASLGCGDHNDQSMVGPCQCGHDKSLRHRRSGDETKSNRAGTADGFRISWTGAVAYGRLDS